MTHHGFAREQTLGFSQPLPLTSAKGPSLLVCTGSERRRWEGGFGFWLFPSSSHYIGLLEL